MKIAFRRLPSRTDIDMVPMINFVFLLLIFFMLVGSLSTPELFRVRPPHSDAAAPADAGASALLVAADGRMALGAEALTPETLAQQLGRWRAVHPGAVLQVKADAQVPAARLVEILEQLRAAGAEQVSLLTSRPAG